MRSDKRCSELSARYGFGGIDWSIDDSRLPATLLEESAWAGMQETFAPLEIGITARFPKWISGTHMPANR